METLSDTDHADAVSSSGRPTTRVHLSLALSLVGLMMITLGLAIDFVLHANDPSLAADEGLFTLANPGHLMLGIGIAATAAGLGLAAWSMILSGGEGSRVLGLAGIAAAIGMAVLVGSVAYVASGPGFGHEHIIPDGADQSRLPRDEGLALSTLAWRGSSILEDAAVHQHGAADSDLDELTADERKTLAAQFEAASAVISKYLNVEDAISAGYTPTSPRVDGVGVHYTKWSLVGEAFDLTNPSQLLYEVVHFGEDPDLVALSYWVTSEHPPEGFAGDADAWHQHFGTCFVNGVLVDEGVPDRDSCAGDWVNGSDLWMVHVWIVPGMENERGVFAAANQAICERICGAEN